MANFEVRVNKLTSNDTINNEAIVKKFYTESKILEFNGATVQPSLYKWFYQMFTSENAEVLSEGTDVHSIIPSSRTLIEQVLASHIGARLNDIINAKLDEIAEAHAENEALNEAIKDTGVTISYTGDIAGDIYYNHTSYEACSLFDALTLRLVHDGEDLDEEERIEAIKQVAEEGINEDTALETVNAMATDTITKLIAEEVLGASTSVFPVEDVTGALKTVLKASKRLLHEAVAHDFDVSGFEASAEEQSSMKTFRTKLLSSVPRSCIIKTTRSTLEVNDLVNIVCKLIGEDVNKLNKDKIAVACRKAWLKANGITCKLTTPKKAK